VNSPAVCGVSDYGGKQTDYLGGFLQKPYTAVTTGPTARARLGSDSREVDEDNMIEQTEKRCAQFGCASPQEYSIRQVTFGRGRLVVSGLGRIQELT
jgi:hypothetical protein